MRFAVYFVAVLAAAGIIYYIGNSGEATVADATPSAVTTGTPSATETGKTVGDEAVEMISVKVPTMHCPFACYPAVKKSLEGTEGVQAVDLVEQKVEGVIDNPVVIVRATDEFDVEKAIASLADEGFENAEVVN